MEVLVREHREKFSNYLYLFGVYIPIEHIYMVVAIISHADYNRFICLFSSIGYLLMYHHH